eukprot:767895-Hanusia_phi.AAC.5
MTSESRGCFGSNMTVPNASGALRAGPRSSTARGAVGGDSNKRLCANARSRSSEPQRPGPAPVARAKCWAMCVAAQSLNSGVG